MKINYKDVNIEFDVSETKEVLGMVKAVGSAVKEFTAFAAKDIANALENPEMVETINAFVKKEALECVSIYHECRRASFDKYAECKKYEAAVNEELEFGNKFPKKFKVDFSKLEELQKCSDGLTADQLIGVLEIDPEATIAELTKQLETTKQDYSDELNRSWERRKEVRRYKEFLETLGSFETKEEMLEALKKFEESESAND